MNGRWRHRPRIGGAAAALLLIAALTGCAAVGRVAERLPGEQPVRPVAVADHDAKLDYHATASAAVLAREAVAQLAAVDSFASVGYVHLVTSTGESLHVQHETSVLGATYWSRESTDDTGLTIDRVHLAGSPTTYLLFGDSYLPATGTPWVGLPEGDLGRSTAELCSLPSVRYLCGISEAWTASVQAQADAVPMRLQVNADGSRHVLSAVTLRELSRVGIFSISPGLAERIPAETFDALLPMHVWTDAAGLVTKAEVNGAIGAEPRIEVQLGFELLGEADPEAMPADPEELPRSYVTLLDDEDEVARLWDDVAAIRTERG